MHRRLMRPLFFLIPLTLLAGNAFSHSPSLDEQRDDYRRAEHALNNHDLGSYHRYAKKLVNYPLYPYLIYGELKQKIKTAKPSLATLKEIEQFENTYVDFPYRTRLRDRWLMKMAKQKRWSFFLKGYQGTKNTSLSCAHVLATYHKTHKTDSFLKAKPLWLVGHNQPKLCEELFSTWQKSKGIPKPLVLKKITLSMESKNFTQAKRLAKRLSASEKHFVNQWIKLLKSPDLLLDNTFLKDFHGSHTLKSTASYQALRLLARINAETALAWLKKHQRHHHFSDDQLVQIKRDIGMYLSHQKSPMAKDFLAALPDSVLDETTAQWRIRLAISIQDWKDAIVWINHLPEHLKNDDKWVYWRARALESLKYPGSKDIFTRLSKQRSYYGFLSALRLNKAQAIHNVPLKVDEKSIKQVANIRAIQRFTELQKLGRTDKARVEWFRALDNRSDPQKLAFAKFAQEKKLFDLAIITVAKTAQRNDIDLRFPLGYHRTVIHNAKTYGLDPAWVFAVIRQESAFCVDAISPAGARGLMQLMPPTAQYLSKRYQLPYYSETSLHEAKLNLQLGSVYLKELKDKMQQNTILASASFNAGPNRVKQWLPTQTMEADIWIDTIPYKETRDYVKNVLVFTSIYRQRLGHSNGFSWMMKPIPATNS